MVFLRLWHYLAGYLEIVVEGPALERFLNLAIRKGIWFWDIKRTNQALRVRMRVGGFSKLRPVARQTRSRVRIVKKNGLPFVVYRFKRRKGLLLGAVLFFAALYLLTSYVWFIEVKGLERLEPRVILEAAAGLGLRPGVPKWSLSSEAIEKGIVDRVPEIAWVGLRYHGTKVIIEAVEKTHSPPVETTPPREIIAGKPGLVTKVLVLHGVAMVKEGDMVTPGQVLIWDPVVQPPDPGTSGLTMVGARGEVKARVWYRGYERVSLEKEITIPTGNEFKRVSIVIKDREVTITGREEIPFAHYRKKVEVKSLPGWRNTNVPVELKIVTYSEVLVEAERLSHKEAQETAIKAVKDRLMRRIPTEARILEIKSEVLDADESGVGVVVTIETEEEIGVPKKSQ